MKARQLKPLQINLEGKLTFEGRGIKAIPVGRPDIVFTDKRTRQEGQFRYGFYGYVEQIVKIPDEANSFVIGNRASEDYAPIQFYRTIKRE